MNAFGSALVLLLSRHYAAQSGTPRWSCEDASEPTDRVVHAGHNPPESNSARSLSARPLLARYRQYWQTT